MRPRIGRYGAKLGEGLTPPSGGPEAGRAGEKVKSTYTYDESVHGSGILMAWEITLLIETSRQR